MQNLLALAKTWNLQLFEEKFNKTLSELFDNIKSNYSYLDKSINSNYTFPLTGKQHVEKLGTLLKKLASNLLTSLGQIIV